MSSVINTLVTSIQNNVFFTCIVLIFITMALILSLAVIFHKIGHKFWKALIPIYNITTLLSILNIPIWMVILIFIPFVNIIGLPFMTIIIGWKLGSICYKNIFIRIGLAICPILFFPLLAAGKIDLTGKYEKIVVVPIEIKKDFSLEPVILTNATEVPNAMNLSQSETLEKIAIKVKKDKPVIEKKEVYTEEKIAEHLAKADKERPTAQDLTFDYNMIYAAKNDNEQLQANAMKDNPTFQLLNQAGMMPIKEDNKVPIKDNSTLDYANLYQEEKEEISFPKIHDIALEVAEEVDESSIGPIPINQRYDKQKKVLEVVNEPIIKANINEEHIIDAIKLEPLELPQNIEPTIEISNLNMAAPPIVDSSISAMVAAPPDFSNQIDGNGTLQIEEIIPVQQIKVEEPSVQVAHMVSMNIEEPDMLPVGVLVKEDKGNKKELLTVLPEEITIPQTSFTTEPVQQFNQMPELLSNPTMIFQTEMGAEPILRPVQAVSNEAQLDKICPRCNVKLKRDCPVCIMCGYRF